MPKSSKPTVAEKSWTTDLDEAAVREAMDEAMVDAYDEYEQHTGLLTAIQEELKFPFKGKVLGEPVTVVDMEWPEGDEMGLDLVCEKNGKRQRIEARSLELVKPWPKGHLLLAAYLMWKRFV